MSAIAAELRIRTHAKRHGQGCGFLLGHNRGVLVGH